ncbi:MULTISPECIES: monovalent cation/H+ antiporter complex subunit F [Frigoribacterium]|uniref:monovalent cation/H+ antiporter complex subunit F n=1 Tax=Frigoribacterium TaxID=96492 RepID=UPI0006B89493|nr:MULTISPECIES: monovalent cation/H+ antiporter complex subunit F [Frigoribacterium]MBD8485122.1 sodium:proton antiporter [Frigoribacterium sp. CFBP 8759]NQW86442.1 sodium:proton antiporter [Frigoribacterium sp. VKM Ac-2860]NQX07774.1 sodium:proton antiporter [Frigoribacterium sp. VKM Ac-2859]KPG85743.1 sodium:proton antiporter [Frigoribacterium sp. RIT-PI-h]KQM25528.1 sodium:proton antiporter [Frigoribacterium sp. Leaf8]
MTVVAYVVGALFAFAGLASVIRIVRGPSILDRMIASDMLLTTLICVLAADMVFNGHTRTIPVILALALTAVLGSITVARYVSKQDPS